MSIIHLAWERNENPVLVLEFRCCSASHLYMPSPYMRCAVRNSQVNKVLFTAWTTYYSLLSGPCFVHPTLQYSTKFPNQGTRLIFIWGLLSLITRVPRPWLNVVVSSPYRYHYVSCTDVRPTFPHIFVLFTFVFVFHKSLQMLLNQFTVLATRHHDPTYYHRSSEKEVHSWVVPPSPFRA